MTWKYEMTQASGLGVRQEGEPRRYSVRRYRVTDTIKVDHSYRHGATYDTREEARKAAAELNRVRAVKR